MFLKQKLKIIEFKYKKMQQIRQQIYSHITNKQVRNYLDENIFKTSLLIAQPYSNNFITKDAQKNLSKQYYSIIKQSLMKNNSLIEANLPIKELLKRIENLVVMDGFWRNVQDINMMKKKIEQLKKDNLRMEMRITQQKIRIKQYEYIRDKMSELSRFSTQQNALSYNIDKDENKKLKQSSLIQDHITYDDHLKQAKQRLSYEKMKQFMIQIVQLSKEQRQSLLLNTRKQYESMLRHISTIQKVIENIEKIHPSQAALKMEVESLQNQLQEKRILVQADQKLDVQIQQLKQKINKIKQLNPQLINPIKPQQQIKSNQFVYDILTKKKQQLQQQIISFQQFIKQEQIQKYQLVKQIQQFNQIFDQEKKINQQLFNKIKKNFYQYPALIDQVLKIDNQDHNKVQFLLDRLGLKFQ